MHYAFLAQMLTKHVPAGNGKDWNTLFIPQNTGDVHVFQLELGLFKTFVNKLVVCLAGDKVTWPVARPGVLWRCELFLSHRIFTSSTNLKKNSDF